MEWSEEFGLAERLPARGSTPRSPSRSLGRSQKHERRGFESPAPVSSEKLAWFHTLQAHARCSQAKPKKKL